MEIDLKTDSRKVKPGDTFIAIRNVNRDGHDYIPPVNHNIQISCGCVFLSTVQLLTKRKGAGQSMMRLRLRQRPEK